MKILLVSFYFFPELGAAPSRITNMANGFKSRGDEIDILTCLPNYPKGRIFEAYRGCLYKKETINGCNVYRYWTYATVSKNPILRGISMISFVVMIWLFAFRRSLVKSYDRIIVLLFRVHRYLWLLQPLHCSSAYIKRKPFLIYQIYGHCLP